jgi:hypothetical protein
MGGGFIDPRFLDLGTSWRWVVSFTPRPFYYRVKRPLYLLDFLEGWFRAFLLINTIFSITTLSAKLGVHCDNEIERTQISEFHTMSTLHGASAFSQVRLVPSYCERRWSLRLTSVFLLYPLEICSYRVLFCLSRLNDDNSELILIGFRRLVTKQLPYFFQASIVF